jgi:hypothetical protein
MSLVSESIVINHRNFQAQKVVEHKEKMIHKAAKMSLEHLSAEIRELAPQLYMQLVCQVNLIADLINRAILFYVQRRPSNLCRFKWRVDQKNTKKIRYEEAFTKVAPSLLQSISLKEPFIAVSEFDYSAMSGFIYTRENAPNYLSEVYGLNVNVEGSLDIGRILREDFAFCDSKASIGIQITDLLASGLRKVLRGKFTNIEEISALLGGLMVQALKNNLPINLISFTDGNISNKTTDSVVNNFRKFAKAIVV